MIRTSRPPHARTLALAALLLLASPLASAQTTVVPTESDVFDALVAGDVERAATLASRAFEATRAPWAALRLAQAEAARGRWIEADAALRELIDDASIDVEERESLRATVAQHLTRLRIDVVPGDASIRVNGVAHPSGTEARIERDVPVVVEVRADGFETTTLRLVPASEIERRTIRLVPVSEATSSTSPDASSPDASARRSRGRVSPLTYVLAGVAVASAGTALGTGLSARSVYDDLERGCGRAGCTDAQIDASGLMPRARATTSLLILGGAAAVSSLVVGLVVRTHPDHGTTISARLSPTSLGIGGSF